MGNSNHKNTRTFWAVLVDFNGKRIPSVLDLKST